jgi:hypothetical protein
MVVVVLVIVAMVVAFAVGRNSDPTFPNPSNFKILCFGKADCERYHRLHGYP